MPKPTLQFSLLLVAMMLSSATWAAAPSGGNSGRNVDERDAANIVREQRGGRVLDVRPQQREEDGYRVKVIEDGRVKVYGVDGRTGKIRE